VIVSIPNAIESVTAVLPTLAGAVVRGSVVLVLALIITSLMRRTSAASRHVVWMSAILVALAVPFLGSITPHWETRVLPAATLTITPSSTTHTALASTSSVRSGVRADAQRANARGSTAITAPVAAESHVTSAVQSGAVVAEESSWGPAEWLALIWLVGALAVFARLGVGTLVVWGTARRATRVNDPDWLVLANRIAHDLGISRPITLLSSDEQIVPVTWGVVYPVVLLPESASEWESDRREAVLVHELAHVGRLDALTQTITQIALALFWFNPLIWIAERRVRSERERACDDLVLSHGTRASFYADDLLRMVQTLTRNTEPAFAALAMARRTEFEGRMLAILDPRTDRRRPGRRGAVAAAIVSLCIALPLAALRPLPKQASPTPSGIMQAITTTMKHAEGACSSRSGHHISVNSGDNESTFSLSDDKHCVLVHSIGKVTYSDDDSRITSISSGGHVTITEIAGGVERRYEASSGSNGLDEKYFVNGKSSDAASGATWLGAVIRDVVRQNAELAPARAARIRSARGVNGVLTEVHEITGDYAKGAYLGALLNQSNITEDTLHRITSFGTNELTSDYAKSEFLGHVSQKSHDPATATAIASAATAVSSDYYKAQLLTKALADAGGGEAMSRQAVAATSDMKSDYYRGNILMDVLSRGKVGDALLLDIISSANRLTSDYYRGNVLDSIAEKQSLNSRNVYTALLASADGIGSSFNHAQVLQAVLSRADLTPDLAVAAINDATRLTSDSDKGRVLGVVTDKQIMKNASVRDAFFAAAKTITSGSEYRRTVSAALP
jgi:beta-lactamase regulating signal transducer with metallopeptidase domain